MARDWKKIAKGIYLVGKEKVVYFRRMVAGRRETKKAELQGAAAIGANGKPSRELIRLYENWSMKLVNKAHYDNEELRSGGRIPTFEDLIELYMKFAPLENAKSGRLTEKVQHNAVRFFKYLVAKCGLQLSEKSDKLTRGKIDIAIAEWIKEGKSKETAKSYAMSCKMITAKWALAMYETEGWTVKPYEMPVIRGAKELKGMDGARYRKLSDEDEAKMDRIYEELWHDKMTVGEYKLWFVATMIFKFEVRPANTGLITMTYEDKQFGRFVEHGGLHYLSYTPQKTANSSGAHVNWPVHPDFWARIEECHKAIGNDADKPLVPNPRWYIEKLNILLHEVSGLKDRAKWCYEWRKLDMHRTFHKFGAAKVAAKSGDEIKTIMQYYADVSWVDVNGMNLDDLK